MFLSSPKRSLHLITVLISKPEDECRRLTQKATFNHPFHDDGDRYLLATISLMSSG